MYPLQNTKRSFSIGTVKLFLFLIIGDYTIKPKISTEGKPVLVRFPNQKLRDAFEQYCQDAQRPLSSQIRVLIARELESLGYLQPNPNRKHTQP